MLLHRIAQSAQEKSEFSELYAGARFYISEILNPESARQIVAATNENPLRFNAGYMPVLCDRSLGGITLEGRNIWSADPFPLHLLEKVLDQAREQGVKVIRLFDPLNDLTNLSESFSLLHAKGLVADGGIVLSRDPEQRPAPEDHKKKSLFSKLFSVEDEKETAVEEIFGDDYYVAKAKEMERQGAAMVSIMDLSGTISTSKVYSLIPKLKHALRIPVAFHSCATSGRGLAATLTAIIKGIDIIDTSISGAVCRYPAIGLLAEFCRILGIDLEVDMEAVGRIRSLIEHDYRTKDNPSAVDIIWSDDFETLMANMPEEIKEQFHIALEAAADNREDGLVDACHIIERYFNISHASLRNSSRIPPAAVQEINKSIEKTDTDISFGEVAGLFDIVRRDCGLPPLSPDIGRIIARQAVALAIDRHNGKPDYSLRTDRFVRLVKGTYGHTPVDIPADFREKITGSPAFQPFDPAAFQEKVPDNDSELSKKFGYFTNYL